MGNHTIITVCGQSGNFELNVMLPVAAYALLQSIELLGTSCTNFARQCVKGLVATSKGPDMVNKGLMTCTNLVCVAPLRTPQPACAFAAARHLAQAPR